MGTWSDFQTKVVHQVEKKRNKITFFFSFEAKLTTTTKCVTTRKLPLWLWTMDPECARPVSPATTLPAPSFPPSSDAHVTSASWSAWDRRTPTSVTRPSPREVSSLRNTPSNTESSPTGTTWRRSGITPSTMSLEFPQRSTPLSTPRRPSTLRLRQYRSLRWHHHVPRYRRSYAEGNHRLGSFHHEDQDHRSSREEIFRLDRRLHLGF